MTTNTTNTINTINKTYIKNNLAKVVDELIKGFKVKSFTEYFNNGTK